MNNRRDKMKIVLKKAITFEGKEINEINLDLDSLTGEDMAQAEREYFATGGHPVVPLLISSGYCAALASRATQYPFEAIMALPLKECHKVVSGVQSFLLGTES